MLKLRESLLHRFRLAGCALAVVGLMSCSAQSDSPANQTLMQLASSPSTISGPVDLNRYPAQRSSAEVTKGREVLDLSGSWRFKTEGQNSQVDLLPAKKPKKKKGEKTKKPKVDKATAEALAAVANLQAGKAVDPNRVTDGEKAGYPLPTFDDSGWESMQVPGAWDLHDKYAYHRGDAWYRTTFDLPKDLSKSTKIQFDAVYYQAEVWLNGERVGENQGGYVNFELPIDQALAKDGKNTLVVRVNNQFKQGAWWPWGGIIRPVRVVRDPKIYLERQHIVAEPDLNTGKASISTTVFLKNSSNAPSKVSLSATVTDVKGKEIAKLSSVKAEPAQANGFTEFKLSGELNSDQYNLWHVDDPNLYYVSVEMKTSDGIEFHRNDRFGIRKVEFDGEIFRLNGEAVRYIGYNRISDDKVNGSSEPTYVTRRDLDRMKASGNNLTRIHHVQQAKNVIEYADEIGILLIGEVPLFGNTADISATNMQTPFEIEQLIYRDYNHPSIFAWCVANEIKASGKEGNAFLKRMKDVAKKFDPTRPVTFSRKSAGGIKATDGTQHMDFPSVNLYGGFAKSTDKIRKLWPNKPRMVTEFSSDGYKFGTERETKEHDTKSGVSVHQWDKQPGVFAASVWSYNDYRSLFWGSSINYTRGWGIQDAWGQVKKGYKSAQDGFAPVKELKLDVNSRQLSLVPRNIPAQEIPSYTLNNYLLVWEVVDAQNNIVDGKVIDLPVIKPGSDVLNMTLPASTAKGAFLERVSLLTPTGHTVKVSEYALQAPQKPVINQVITSNGGVRVAYTPAVGVEQYELIVRSASKDYKKSVALSSSITIEGLPNNESLSVTLRAINAKGGNSSEIVPVKLSADAGEMAPEIQAMTPLKNGYVLGFIKRGKGYIKPGSKGLEEAKTIRQWVVEVADVEANKKVVAEYVTESIGSTRYESLKPGHDYLVRIRREDGGAWSEWVAVKTEGKGKPELNVLGAVNGQGKAVVRIQPHPKAVRYAVTATSNNSGEVISKVIERAAVPHLIVDGLHPEETYAISVQVETASGTSEHTAAQ